MELVEGDPRIGQIVGHSFDEGRRHIDADRFDIFGVGLVGARIVSKADNGPGVAPFGDEYDLARLRLRPTSRVECADGLDSLIDATAYDGQIATCLPSPFILPLWGYRP
jgi:hypothetical protein